jgi:hypothetical protein
MRLHEGCSGLRGTERAADIAHPDRGVPNGRSSDMQNAEDNPTQKQQNEMAAKSPVHTPAAGTASPDAHTQAKEFGSSSNAGAAEPTR